MLPRGRRRALRAQGAPAPRSVVHDRSLSPPRVLARPHRTLRRDGRQLLPAVQHGLYQVIYRGKSQGSLCCVAYDRLPLAHPPSLLLEALLT